MQNLTIFFVMLFLVKLVWNIWLPFSLERKLKLWQSGMGRKPKSISMLIYIELTLLVLAIATAHFTDQDTLFGNPFEIGTYGVLAIIFSYLASIVLARVGRRQ